MSCIDKTTACDSALPASNYVGTVDHSGGLGVYGSSFAGPVTFNAAFIGMKRRSQTKPRRLPSRPVPSFVSLPSEKLTITGLQDLESRLRALELAVSRAKQASKTQRPTECIASARSPDLHGTSPKTQSRASHKPRARSGAGSQPSRSLKAKSRVTETTEEYSMILVRIAALAYEERGRLVAEPRGIVDEDFANASTDTQLQMLQCLGRLRLLLWLLDPTRVLGTVYRPLDPTLRAGYSLLVASDMFQRGFGTIRGTSIYEIAAVYLWSEPNAKRCQEWLQHLDVLRFEYINGRRRYDPLDSDRDSWRDASFHTHDISDLQVMHQSKLVYRILEDPTWWHV